MVFHWRLSDSKSPQVFRTLLSILAVLNNAVIWMVSTRPPTSKSSRPFNNPLVTVPKAPITIGTIIIIIIIIWEFRVFPTRQRWWFFTGVWVTTILLRSPNFYFQVFVFKLNIFSLTDMLLSVGNDLSSRRHVSFYNP